MSTGVKERGVPVMAAVDLLRAGGCLEGLLLLDGRPNRRQTWRDFYDAVRWLADHGDEVEVGVDEHRDEMVLAVIDRHGLLDALADRKKCRFKMVRWDPRAHREGVDFMTIPIKRSSLHGVGS